MTLKVFLLVCILWMTLNSLSVVWGIEIITPTQSMEVRPGDSLTIKVVPSPGENVGSVFFGGLFGTRDETAPYEHQLVIGQHDIGMIKFDIFAITPEGEFSSRIVLNLISSLPSEVTLQSVELNADQGILFLEPEVLRTKQIGVAGRFSDGVRRSIKGSSFGTIYESSNEKVVMVDSEGVLHAVSVGRAIITVKNGDKIAQTQVEVKAKP